MSDLEITRLCAEAMGYTLQPYSKGFRCRNAEGYVVAVIGDSPVSTQYAPLYDDAQALALVKKFELCIQPPIQVRKKEWHVWVGTARWDEESPAAKANYDLNRAICECVAKMQAAK